MLTPFLTTKLHIPPFSGQRVARPRLLQRLEAGLHCPLTLISAPAGYGKTVLLSYWAQRLAAPEPGRAPVPAAWVALDPGDNDLVRFWGYVLAALDRLPALAGALTELLDALRTASNPALEPVLVGLLNTLSERGPQPAVALILDDLHVITAPAIYDSLAYVIEHAPPQLHLVLASRADPPLPLGRLRARGGLVELRAHDLRFSTDEAAAFLNGVMRLALPAEAVADLETRTEGWITGLQLAALTLSGQADLSAAVQAFSGQHRFVLDYLVEEVVGRQPESVRAFLEQTSILARLSAPLCEAVTQQPHAAATLAGLYHANLFTEPLDETGQWYRIHHLFAEVLAGQLQRSQPEQVPTLHRRARDWYAAHGFLNDALHHALATADYGWVAEMIEREYRALVARGELVTLRQWLECLPAAVLEARPKTCLAYAWALAYPGRFDELAHYLARAEALVAGATGPEAEATRAEVLGVRAVIGSMRGTVENVVAQAQQALALTPPGDHLLQAVAWQAIGNAERLRGRTAPARHAFETVLSLGAAIGGPVTLAATVRLGHVLVMQGQLRAAAAAFERALGQVGERGGQLVLYTSEAHTRLGDLYREWNQLDTALEHVRRGLELARRADNMPAVLTAYFTQLHAQAAGEQWAAAEATLAEARRLAERLDFPNLSARVSTHAAWLAWVARDRAGGDQAVATAWSEAYAAERAAGAEVATDLQEALLARIWLGQGRAADARQVSGQLLATAEPAGRHWTAAQAEVLAALAHAALGEPAPAAEALRGALHRAAPGDFVRLFLDEGEPLRRVLAESRRAWAAADPAQAYAQRLLAAWGAPPAPSASPARPGAAALVEPLSPRELEVLRLMAEGHSNRAIAEALVISVGTVKSHTNRILGKLAAHSRTQAVARARRLALL